MKIPYGEADFSSLRKRRQVYIDRTDRIPVLEGLGERLLFLRPRRFGKSLWLSTLAAYYDLRNAGEHETLFGGLAVGEQPTDLAHRYFVLRWDFSEINPDPPLRGVNAGIEARHQRLANDIHDYLQGTVSTFLLDYQGHLPHPVALVDDAFHTLDNLLAAIRQTPYRLYILLDEYDNFANEVLTDDRNTYEKLVHSDGPFKFLFKWVKAALGHKGVDRLFVTGVSPLVMSDVTSGMNIVRNVSLKRSLADLCGFTTQEVQDLVSQALGEPGDGTVKTADALLMMREWYNGYRFALGAPGKVYNPTLVFYFLLELLEEGAFPRQMLDANLAADESKLDYLAQVVTQRPEEDVVLDLIRNDKPLQVQQIHDRFTLKELLEPPAQDVGFLGSYLFYFGMLTLREEETNLGVLELTVPNHVMHGLYVGRLRKLLMPLGPSRSRAGTLLIEFLEDGDLQPLLDFVESTLFPTFSNRDAVWANELTVKTLFLLLLWNDRSYITHSEPELDHRYADLCMLRRPDARGLDLHDLLFEFKRLSLEDLGLSGQDVRDASREELAALPKVQDALDRAEEQITAYRAALVRRYGEALRLRSYAVVALGFERLVVAGAPP